MLTIRILGSGREVRVALNLVVSFMASINLLRRSLRTSFFRISADNVSNGAENTTK